MLLSKLWKEKKKDYGKGGGVIVCSHRNKLEKETKGEGEQTEQRKVKRQTADAETRGKGEKRDVFPLNIGVEVF